jgi:hypothetical protein
VEKTYLTLIHDGDYSTALAELERVCELERVAGVIICKESCLSSIVCRSCSEKNASLISKLDAVREQFNLTTERLAEKQSESVTKRERKKETSESSDAYKNPVKMFSRKKIPFHKRMSKRRKPMLFKYQMNFRQ